MDYVIRRWEEVEGYGGFVEIGPGRWSQHYGGDGYAIFVDHEAFWSMAEGIIWKHSPPDFFYGANHISKEAGHKIIKDWRLAAEQFSSMTLQEVKEQLYVPSGYYPILESEILQHGPEISFMLKRLAIAVDKFYQMDEWIYIMGI